VGYYKIFLIKISYERVKWDYFYENWKMLNSLKDSLKPGYVLGQNEHNHEN